MAILNISITLKLWPKHPLLYGQELDFRGHKAGDSTENRNIGMNRTIFLKYVRLFMDFMWMSGWHKGLRPSSTTQPPMTHSYDPLEQLNYQSQGRDTITPGTALSW